MTKVPIHVLIHVRAHKTYSLRPCRSSRSPPPARHLDSLSQKWHKSHFRRHQSLLPRCSRVEIQTMIQPIELGYAWRKPEIIRIFSNIEKIRFTDSVMSSDFE